MSSDAEARLRRVEQLLVRLLQVLTNLEQKVAKQDEQVYRIPSGGNS